MATEDRELIALQDKRYVKARGRTDKAIVNSFSTDKLGIGRDKLKHYLHDAEPICLLVKDFGQQPGALPLISSGTNKLVSSCSISSFGIHLTETLFHVLRMAFRRSVSSFLSQYFEFFPPMIDQFSYCLVYLIYERASQLDPPALSTSLGELLQLCLLMRWLSRHVNQHHQWESGESEKSDALDHPMQPVLLGRKFLQRRSVSELLSLMRMMHREKRVEKMLMYLYDPLRRPDICKILNLPARYLKKILI